MVIYPINSGITYSMVRDVWSLACTVCFDCQKVVTTERMGKIQYTRLRPKMDCSALGRVRFSPIHMGLAAKSPGLCNMLNIAMRIGNWIRSGRHPIAGLMLYFFQSSIVAWLSLSLSSFLLYFFFRAAVSGAANCMPRVNPICFRLSGRVIIITTKDSKITAAP